MIRETDVFKIGKLAKPHGVKGEISFLFDNDIFDKVDCPYLICLIDNIYVPFFVEQYRFKGKDTALITFEDIDSEEKARRLSGLEIFFPKKYLADVEGEEDDDYSWSYFLGFKIIDSVAGEIGEVVAVDETTMNTLFCVEKSNGEEIIIPASEDLIGEIDEDNEILYMNLPDGLLE